MKRLVYIVSILMLSVTLWAVNSTDEEDWYLLEDSHAYYERIENSMEDLTLEESMALLNYFDFKSGIFEANEEVNLLDRNGEFDSEMLSTFNRGLSSLAEAYNDLKLKFPRAARIAGAMMADAEVLSNDVCFGLVYYVFIDIAQSEWGAANKEKAQQLERAAEQMRQDYVSFK